MTWRCTVCKRTRELGDALAPLTPSLSDKYLKGKCKKCRGIRMFERVPLEVYRVLPAGKQDAALSERLAQKGMGQAELSEEISASGWNERADAVIRALAVQRIEFTAEDVTRRVGIPARSTGAVGARINSAARRGIIQFTGRIVKAKRPSRHANALRVWRGT